MKKEDENLITKQHVFSEKKYLNCKDNKVSPFENRQ